MKNQWITGLKCLLLVTSLGGAFIAARSSKAGHETGLSPATPAAPRVLSPMEVLALVSVQEDGGAGGFAVTEAVGKVRAALQRPELWVNLGDLLRQRLRDTGDAYYYDLAELTYRQALSLQPTGADAMNGMAWLTGGRHQFDESMDWANRALGVSPGSADAHGILGDAELELGNYDAATTHYQKMMDLRPDLSSWSRSAWLLWITGDKTRGIGFMEQAIRAGGPFAENTEWCRARLATMRLHEGNHSAAAEALAPCLRQHSRNPHILLAAARLATATGDHEVARQYYQMLLAKGPNHDALVGLGDLLAMLGEKDEAEKTYLQVEALHAAHESTGLHSHLEMARFLADHDREPLVALRLAEQHKLTRNVLEADTLAWVYLKNGHLDRARAAIKVALSQNTPDAAIHYHAGMIAVAAGDPEEGRSRLSTALQMNPCFDPLQAPIAERVLADLTKQRTSSGGLAVNPEPGDGTP